MREIVLILYFTASFLFTACILYYFILFDKRVERRLQYYLDIDKKYKSMKKKKEKGKVVNAGLKSINEFIKDKLSEESQERIDQMLRSAGIELDAEDYIIRILFFVVFTALLAWLIFGHFLFIIPGGIAGYIIPRMWVSKKRKKRIQSFNEGLPDMVATIIGSLRSGYSFTQAMKTVAEECESPIKDEIALLLMEMSYGISMEEALNNLNERMPSNDLELMIQAILIQRQVGGNLSMILEIIVKTIRERNKLERQVQTLTAQGRLSGRVIGLLPVILGVAIYFINPEYMTAFFASFIGRIAIGVGIMLSIIGFLLVNKLTKIEV
jgi:tight adherence protein B